MHPRWKKGLFIYSFGFHEANHQPAIASHLINHVFPRKRELVCQRVETNGIIEAGLLRTDEQTSRAVLKHMPRYQGQMCRIEVQRSEPWKENRTVLSCRHVMVVCVSAAALAKEEDRGMQGDVWCCRAGRTFSAVAGALSAAAVGAGASSSSAARHICLVVWFWVGEEEELSCVLCVEIACVADGKGEQKGGVGGVFISAGAHASLDDAPVPVTSANRKRWVPRAAQLLRPAFEDDPPRLGYSCHARSRWVGWPAAQFTQAHADVTRWGASPHGTCSMGDSPRHWGPGREGPASSNPPARLVRRRQKQNTAWHGEALLRKEGERAPRSYCLRWAGGGKGASDTLPSQNERRDTVHRSPKPWPANSGLLFQGSTTPHLDMLSVSTSLGRDNRPVRHAPKKPRNCTIPYQQACRALHTQYFHQQTLYLPR